MALLKPCPFCAEDMASICHDEFDVYYVSCDWCNARGPSSQVDSEGRDAAEDAAIDGWNERV